MPQGHRKRLIVTWLPALVIILAGCSADRIAAPPQMTWQPPKPLADPIHLIVPTYDGSGQAVEPDVVYFTAPWHGWEFWMVMAPYPYGDDAKENPSILVSHDGVNWSVPPGVTNPLVQPPTDGINSDPELLYDRGNDRLVVSYRVVRTDLNVIKGISSSDGVAWSTPRTFFRVPSHGAVGQSLTMRDGVNLTAWYVNSGRAGCSAHSSTVERRVAAAATTIGVAGTTTDWSAPHDVALTQRGFVIWHVDVAYVPEVQEYWAVYAAYRPEDGCGKCELFLAQSRDGKVWTTYPGPFLVTGTTNWSDASLYRASFLFTPSSDQLTVWFSARSKLGVWSLGLVKYRFTDFISALQRQPGMF